jgi:hypothetical protein
MGELRKYQIILYQKIENNKLSQRLASQEWVVLIGIQKVIARD